MVSPYSFWFHAAAILSRGRVPLVVGVTLLVLSTSASHAEAAGPEEEPSLAASAAEREGSLLVRPGGGAPTPVRIRFLLLDLSAVDGASQSFNADFAVRAEWEDDRWAGRSDSPLRLALSEAWHPHLEIVNKRSASGSFPEALRAFPDGTMQYTQRYIGQFSAPLDLRDFPLDRQRFPVQVVPAGGDGAQLEFVLDEGGVPMPEAFSVSDWRIDAVGAELMPFSAGLASDVLPGAALVVDAARLRRYYVVQVILPLMMIVIMAWTVFWIDPAVVPTRMGTVVTTVLTLIAYRFAFSSLVPRLSYLTRLDWFLLGSSLIVLLSLLTIAATAYLKSRGQDAVIGRIDRSARVLFLVAAAAAWTLPWVL